MSTVTVVDQSGKAHNLPIVPNRTLMELIRDAGLDELQALCGGCLSCATCHVYISPNSSVTLGSISPDEGDLLESADNREATSRLSCQIIVQNEMDGLVVTIAPGD